MNTEITNAGDAGGMPQVERLNPAAMKQVWTALNRRRWMLRQQLRAQLARLFRPEPAVFIVKPVPASGVSFTAEPPEPRCEGEELPDAEPSGPLMHVRAQSIEISGPHELMAFIFVYCPPGVMPGLVGASGLGLGALAMLPQEAVYLYRTFEREPMGRVDLGKWYRARALMRAAVGMSLPPVEIQRLRGLVAIDLSTAEAARLRALLVEARQMHREF